MMAGLEETATVGAPLRVEVDPQERVGPVAPVPPRGTVVATTSRMGVPVYLLQMPYSFSPNLVGATVVLTPETTCIFLV